MKDIENSNNKEIAAEIKQLGLNVRSSVQRIG
jgi:hypothetical protein